MTHLTPQELLARSRFSDMGGIFVDHPHYTPTYSRLRLGVAMAGSDEEVPGMLLTGPPGAGKTTSKLKLEEEFPRRRKARTVKLPRQPAARCDHIPFLHFRAPSAPTVKSFVAAALKAIGDPNWDQSIEEHRLNARFDTYVEACGVLAILIDDAQRVVDAGGVAMALHLAEWLTERHSANPVVFILAGLGRIKHLFKEDAFLARRWDAELRLEPYYWITADGEPHDDQDGFIAILKQFREFSPLPFDVSVDIEDEAIAYRFIYASRGLIGLVKKILKKAMMLVALDDQAPFLITLPLLARAYDEAVGGELRLPQNAFYADFTPNISQAPPPLLDDHLLLPPAAAQRRQMTRRMRDDRARAALRKG